MSKGIFYIPCYPKKTKTHKVLDDIKKSITLCDKYNVEEAYFGEHIADKHEKVASSLMMAASVSQLTNKIKLGTLTTNLNFYHPSILAAQIAFLDNLSGGRLILGIGSGSNRSDVELNNLIEENNYFLTLEILKLTEKLLNSKDLVKINSKNFKISSKKYGNKILGLGYFDKLYKNRKNLEYIMPALNPNSRNVISCAKKGWGIVISNFCDEKVIENHILSYLKHTKLDKKQALKKIRVARFIFVTKNKEDKKKVFNQNSPYMQVLRIIYKKLKKNKIIGCFGENNNLNKIAESLFVVGTPLEIKQKILNLKKKYGKFKNLIYVHVPSSGNIIFDNSLKLFSKNVKL